MTQEEQLLLNDVQLKIKQYLYRSFESSFDNVISTIQTSSLLNNLNWHLPANKNRLKNVFVLLNTEIDSFTLANGDFRSYLLLAFVNAVYTEFKVELFKKYLNEGYNVSPESIVGSLDDAYSTQAPQNTNFPYIQNTSSINDPSPTGIKLVPDSLYTDSD